MNKISYTSEELWSRHNIPAYSEIKRFLNGKQIYYQDFVGYLHFSFSSLYFNINSHGFRTPPFTLKRQDQRFRVILLGASALQGVPNCADDETIAYHLQSLLDAQECGVEVINLGIRSYSIKNELNLLYRLALDMEFDAIVVFDGYADMVFGYFGNVFNGYNRVYDFLKSAWLNQLTANECWFLERASDASSRLEGSGFLKSLAYRLLGRFSSCPQRHQAPPSQQGTVSTLDAAFRQYLQFAESIIDFAATRKVPVLFAPQPCLESTKKPLHRSEAVYLDYLTNKSYTSANLSVEQVGERFRRHVQQIGSLCERRNIAFLDTGPLVDELTENDVAFFDEVHLYSCANFRIAEAISQFLVNWCKDFIRPPERDYGIGSVRDLAAEQVDDVPAFYDRLPFNFDESPSHSAKKIRSNPLKAYPELQEILSSGTVHAVLEAGCGVGWLANSVALHHQLFVKAIDITPRALSRAREISEFLGTNKLISFEKADLLSLDASLGDFDLVVSLGVLHHTKDAKCAFRNVAARVKAGGYLFIGLYHEHARKVMLDYYRSLIRNDGIDTAFRKFILASDNLDNPSLQRSWFADQILHPQESLHTLAELKIWLKEVGFDFVSSSLEEFGPCSEPEDLLKTEINYGRFSFARNVMQHRFLPGFFTVLARRQAP